MELVEEIKLREESIRKTIRIMYYTAFKGRRDAIIAQLNKEYQSITGKKYPHQVELIVDEYVKENIMGIESIFETISLVKKYRNQISQNPSTTEKLFRIPENVLNNIENLCYSCLNLKKYHELIKSRTQK